MHGFRFLPLCEVFTYLLDLCLFPSASHEAPSSFPALLFASISTKSKKQLESTMKTVALLSLIAGSAVAFAPSQSAKQSSALSADFSNDFGAMKPVSFSMVEAFVCRRHAVVWLALRSVLVLTRSTRRITTGESLPKRLDG